MNGREFIDCAERLAKNSQKADLRSAVNRAYYGAYHVVHDFLENCGIRFSTSTTEAHTKMPQCLENANVPEVHMVGRSLRSLRDDRNYADYDLDESAFEDSASVQFCLQTAHLVVQAIDAIVDDPTVSENTRRILRTCAKSLGLQVV